MRAARLEDALERLATAIRDVESELAAMKAEHDPRGYARHALSRYSDSEEGTMNTSLVTSQSPADAQWRQSRAGSTTKT